VVDGDRTSTTRSGAPDDLADDGHPRSGDEEDIGLEHFFVAFGAEHDIDGTHEHKSQRTSPRKTPKAVVQVPDDLLVRNPRRRLAHQLAVDQLHPVERLGKRQAVLIREPHLCLVYSFCSIAHWFSRTKRNSPAAPSPGAFHVHPRISFPETTERVNASS
jgi:hypothetical protein